MLCEELNEYSELKFEVTLVQVEALNVFQCKMNSRRVSHLSKVHRFLVHKPED